MLVMGTTRPQMTLHDNSFVCTNATTQLAHKIHHAN